MEDYEVQEQLDAMIKNESARIMNILLDMYDQKTKVNKSFNCLVSDFMNEEYRLFESTILSKVTSLIPLDLMICPSSEWVFVTNLEYYHIFHTEQMNSIKASLNQNKEIIDELSVEIITQYKSENLSNKNILEILYNFIAKQQLEYIDSDVIGYIVQDIVFSINQNYNVKSINPLIINGL